MRREKRGPGGIQSQVTQIGQQIGNPNSSYNQQQANAVAGATNWITGTNGGYVVFRRNAEGQPYEILIMDQPTIEAATKVWRWNNGGLGYSSNGYNGPYTTAITQDGAIVADFITTGVLNAAIITAGILQSKDGSSSWNLDTGDVNLTGAINTVWSNAGYSAVLSGAGVKFYRNNGQTEGGSTEMTEEGLKIIADGLWMIQGQKFNFTSSQLVVGGMTFQPAYTYKADDGLYYLTLNLT